MYNETLTNFESNKHLRITFESSGSWHKHIQLITSKAWQWIRIMRKLKFHLDRKSLDIIYTSFIRPILEYADVVWCNLTKYQEDELEKIQIEAARIVTGATKLVSHDNLYIETCWETLNSRRKQHKLTLYYKMIKNFNPSLPEFIGPPSCSDMSSYSLRNSDQYQTIDIKSQLYYNSVLPSAVREWNALNSESQSCPSVTSFKMSISNRQVVPNFLFYWKQN